MTMGVIGFKTKKELKGAVGKDFGPHVLETSIFGNEYRANDWNTVVGPTPHERKWFARVLCKAGVIEKVE